MFCAQCGTQNPDNNAFCEQCGAKIQEQQSFEPVYTKPVYRVRQLSSHPVINVLKKIAGSPLFLAAVIAFSVQVLFAVINSVNDGSKIHEYAYVVLNAFAAYIPREVYNVISEMIYSSDVAGIFIAIICQIPSMVLCAGLWILYASAKDRRYDGMKTAGITIIKVTSVINLIGTCIGAAAVELLLVLMAMLYMNLGIQEAEVLAVYMLVLAVFGIVAGVILIFYDAKIIQSINRAKNTALTGVFSKKASVFVGVYSFIIAFLNIITMVTDMTFVNVMFCLATIAELVCFALVIFKYNESMKEVSIPAEPDFQQEEQEQF